MFRDKTENNLFPIYQIYIAKGLFLLKLNILRKLSSSSIIELDFQSSSKVLEMAK